MPRVCKITLEAYRPIVIKNTMRIYINIVFFANRLLFAELFDIDIRFYLSIALSDQRKECAFLIKSEYTLSIEE